MIRIVAGGLALHRERVRQKLFLRAQSKPSLNGERPGFSSQVFPCPVLSPCRWKCSPTLWQEAALLKCRSLHKRESNKADMPVFSGALREARGVLCWEILMLSAKPTAASHYLAYKTISKTKSYSRGTGFLYLSRHHRNAKHGLFPV